jgi:hypothetical protein
VVEECQYLAKQPGDVHLGDPNLLSDLSLGAVVEKPQREDSAFPGAQLGEQRAQRFPVVDKAYVDILVTDELVGNCGLAAVKHLVEGKASVGLGSVYRLR